MNMILNSKGLETSLGDHELINKDKYVTFPKLRASWGSLKAVNSLGLPYRFTKHGPNVGRKPRLSSTVGTKKKDIMFYYGGVKMQNYD